MTSRTFGRRLANLPPILRREFERQADPESGPLWRPYPGGPQERALDSPADIIGYGGQAGGGKTDFILGAALTRHTHSIIFRREYPQLSGMVERSQEIIGPNGKFNDTKNRWRGLPGNRAIDFGAIQYAKDKEKYRGRPHDLIAMDEATEHLESVFWFLMGWLRTTVPGQRCRAILTFNPPTTVEGQWVVRFFAPWLDRNHHNPAVPGELRWFARVGDDEVERPDGEPFDHEGETIQPMSRTFFPAALKDNPILAATGYGRNLQNLPEPLRSQLLKGDFAAGLEDDAWQLIPTAWVEAAQARWRPDGDTAPMTCLGVDVAHGGKDKTVLARRHGRWFAPLLKYPGVQTPNGSTAASLVVKAWRDDADVNVDAIGYGASAAERLTEKPPQGHGIPARPVNVANRSHFRDRSGKYGMMNVRAEMFWRLREALDPEGPEPISLPPDPELKADLTAGKYQITTTGIKVELKADIAARIGRSPDCGDAVGLAMLPGPPVRHAPGSASIPRPPQPPLPVGY